MPEIIKKPGIFSRIAGSIAGGLTGLVTGVFTGAVRGLGVVGNGLMGAADGLIGIGLVGLAILPAIAIGAIVVAAYGAYEGVRNGGLHGFVEGVKAGASAAVSFERQEVGMESKKEPALPVDAAAVSVAKQAPQPGSTTQMNKRFNSNPAAPVRVSQVAAAPQQVTEKVASPGSRNDEKIQASKDEARNARKNPPVDTRNDAIEEKSGPRPR